MNQQLSLFNDLTDSKKESDIYNDPPLEAEENLEIGEITEPDLDSPVEDVNDVYPNANVRVTKDQYSLLHIKRLVEKRKELIISPNYQRKDVWSPRQRMELIESILMGIPLPVIYLFEDRNGNKQVVDGRQRVTAIVDFLNDEFTLKDLKILPQYNGKKFSELPGKAQGIFEDFQILCYIIQPPTPERVKYDIFDRVNRGGTKLNSQEMRNALYRGEATSLIKMICDSEFFLNATDKSISPTRMRNGYATLRSIAFYLLFTDRLGNDIHGRTIVYRSDMDDFLAKVMITINHNFSKEKRYVFGVRILKAFKEIFDTLGNDAFRFESKGNRKRAINMPLMETLTFLFMLDWKRPDKEVVRSIINEFKAEADAPDSSFGSRVDSSVSVRRRFGKMVELAHAIDPDYSTDWLKHL
ncbi:MAG: DUF262 domain-containing protein [Muribaculaceae bacterium]|nr:DUF262 domain-containing protein [Muribaculaceae bacterium]